MITATNKATGELIELPADTPQEIVDAWLIAQEYAKAADSLKDQLKKLVPTIVDDSGKSPVINNYMFRSSMVQRQTYDKSVIRNVLDEDMLDHFTVVKKSLVDTYIKDNLEELGDLSSELRKGLVPDGAAYSVIKLEKVSE